MLFLRRETTLFDGQPKRMLHVAPEEHLQDLFRSTPGIDYLSGDIASPHAMERLDVTDLRFEDGSFDVVLCSHVLEHVDDDLAAMSELYRVLKPGGWGILDAPINETYADTYEDWTITTPEGRLEAFGQVDHVRIFGRNYAELLARPGFEVDVDRYHLADGEKERFGLRPGIDHIWFCRKPA